MCLTQVQPLQSPIKEERLLPSSCVRYTQMKGARAPKSPSTGSLLRLAHLFLPRSTHSSRKRMMINTTITIAPINRLMGLFTFVSPFSYPHFPKRALELVYKSIVPSYRAWRHYQSLGHKVGALITEPGPLFAFRVSKNIICRKSGFREGALLSIRV